MHRYLNLHRFLGRRPFPVDDDAVVLRSTMFRPGRTVWRYTTHIATAPILLRHPADWLKRGVKSAATGMRNAQSLPFCPRNLPRQ